LARCAGPGRGRSAADANERSEGNFRSTKITQEVREFAAKQNQPSDAFIAAEEAESGMAEMSERFREVGEIYVISDDGQGIEAKSASRTSCRRDTAIWKKST